MTSEETKWEVEMEPDRQESTKGGQRPSIWLSPELVSGAGSRPHPGLLNLDLNFNKVPEDVDEVSEAQY